MPNNKQKQRRRPASSGVRSGRTTKQRGAASKQKASTSELLSGSQRSPSVGRAGRLCRACGDTITVIERDGLFYGHCGCGSSFAYVTAEGAAYGRKL